MSDIGPDLLRELLAYDPETGDFHWRVRRGGHRAGSPAGVLLKSGASKGYVAIRIGGKRYLAHRLAWLHVFGYWPDGLDHRDGDRSRNAIGNLREADHAENGQNRGKLAGKSSKYIGVNYRKDRRKWHARIEVADKRHSLGVFETEQEAYEAYRAAKARLHTFNPAYVSRAAFV